MKVLKDFDYEAGAGSDIFYDYFYHKCGIGADPEAPVTYYLENLVDVFHNNGIYLANMLYEGILSPEVLVGYDDDLRKAWLNEIGKDIGLQNGKGVIYGYETYKYLDTDRYNKYLYLRNCRLRTLEDWKYHFDLCFNNEEDDSLESRITYKNNQLYLHFKQDEDWFDKWFMGMLFKNLIDYNLVHSTLFEKFFMYKDDFRVINIKDDGKQINDNFFIYNKYHNVARLECTGYDPILNGANFKCDSVFFTSQECSLILRNKDLTLDFIVDYKLYVKKGVDTLKLKFLKADDDEEVDHEYETHMQNGKWYRHRFRREGSTMYHDVNDGAAAKTSIGTGPLRPAIVTDTDDDVEFVIKDFVVYNLPRLDDPTLFLTLNVDKRIVESKTKFTLETLLKDVNGTGVEDATLKYTDSDGNSWSAKTESGGRNTYEISSINKPTYYYVEYENLKKSILVEHAYFYDTKGDTDRYEITSSTVSSQENSILVSGLMLPVWFHPKMTEGHPKLDVEFDIYCFNDKVTLYCIFNTSADIWNMNYYSTIEELEKGKWIHMQATCADGIFRLYKDYQIIDTIDVGSADYFYQMQFEYNGDMGGFNVMIKNLAIKSML